MNQMKLPEFIAMSILKRKSVREWDVWMNEQTENQVNLNLFVDYDRLNCTKSEKHLIQIPTKAAWVTIFPLEYFPCYFSTFFDRIATIPYVLQCICTPKSISICLFSICSTSYLNRFSPFDFPFHWSLSMLIEISRPAEQSIRWDELSWFNHWYF